MCIGVILSDIILYYVFLFFLEVTFYIHLVPVMNLSWSTESMKGKGGKLLYKPGCVYRSF